MRLGARLNALLVLALLGGLGVVAGQQLGLMPRGGPAPEDIRAPRSAGPSAVPLATDIKRGLAVATPDPGLQRLDPRSFTVRLLQADTLVPGLSTRLPSAWATATRGLGKLRLMTANSQADITVYFSDLEDVSSENERYRGRFLVQRWIEIYTRRSGQPRGLGELQSVVLHELGHLWCCAGEGAAADGHWAVDEVDPRLTGVNRYGLMGPVNHCDRSKTPMVCPDRFSDRELRAMGFTDLPAPR